MSVRRLFALALLAAACSKAPPGKGAEEHEHEKHEEHGDEHKEHGDEHDEHGEAESDHVELTPEAAARVTVTTAPVEARDLLGEIVTTAEVGFDQDHLAHVTPRLGGPRA
jgi:cobalt-zinc-cadmium efflux system membrane fusion protein